MKDPVTAARIKLLHPKIRQQSADFVEAFEKATGLTLRITQGLRTFAEQQAIYNQGRTTPGKIVTWSPAGSSYHNYGLAIDTVPMHGETMLWGYDFSKLVPFAKGFEWGGDFPPGKKDMDHFENRFGLNWRDMLHKYFMKDFIPGTQFINI